MIPKGHGEGHPRPLPGHTPNAPADEDHPGDTTRDIPEDDLSLQISEPATNSKTVNRLESAPRCS